MSNGHRPYDGMQHPVWIDYNTLLAPWSKRFERQ